MDMCASTLLKYYPLWYAATVLCPVTVFPLDVNVGPIVLNLMSKTGGGLPGGVQSWLVPTAWKVQPSGQND